MATIELKGGDQLQKRLAEIAAKLGSAKELRVGYLEGATYPDGTSVPMVAAAQNWGTDKLPARPFFSNMITKNEDGWPALIEQGLKRSGMDAKAALTFTGQIMTEQLKASILEQNFVPLKPETVARKGFATILVDTAAGLLNGSAFEVE